VSWDAVGKLELRKEKKRGPHARGRGPTKTDRKEPGYDTSKEMSTITAKVGNV
jgi:hypothetical protein